MSSPASKDVAWRRLTTALRSDRAGGLTLTVAAIAALIWANWSGDSYAHTWMQLAPWSRALGLHLSIQDWVDQGLLFVFFALVGLEIRREVTVGELGSLRRAAVPVAAALVGMAIPALVYTAVIAGGPGAAAWGVPMATDVAFAVGALGLIGGGSRRARVFLMTLAVADDIASILILVLFYSRGLQPIWLVVGVASVIALVPIWWSRAPVAWLRALLVLLAWWAMLHAGVDAAVIGVTAGLWGPRRRPVVPLGPPKPGMRVWVLRLTPAVNGVVLPVFALANIGIRLSGSVFASGPTLRIFLAVVVARILGKPAGIAAGTLGSRYVVRDGSQPRISRRILVGVGAVAGVGFTVPLLIIKQALPPGPLAVAATAGLLVGSVLSVGSGALLLRYRRSAPFGPLPAEAVRPASEGS